MRDEKVEQALLCSILKNGIRDALEGVDTQQTRILLNGFKRYRCAQHLGIQIVPYVRLGNDEAMGILHLLRLSNARSLSILEQAKLIDELKKIHRMSLTEIAQSLERSKAWVSMRVGILNTMSDFVRMKLFKGEFPVYSYMYILRQFMRMNYATKEEIDEFVKATSGKRLSTRDIERLAYGYFRGPAEFREQIRDGNILWGLDILKKAYPQANEYNETERGMLKDLEVVQKYIQRVIRKSKDTRFKSNSFFAQANLLAGGILSKISIFTHQLRDFYDRTGHENNNLSAPQGGMEHPKNKP
jgi:hypothetical protein